MLTDVMLLMCMEQVTVVSESQRVKSNGINNEVLPNRRLLLYACSVHVVYWPPLREFGNGMRYTDIL